MSKKTPSKSRSLLEEHHKAAWMKQWPYIFSEENAQSNQSIESIIERVFNYYDGIISCMPGNVYWLDQHCITVGCNQNVLRMFNLKNLSEFVGLTFEEMGEIGNWSKEATISFKKDSLEVLTTGKPKFNIEEEPIPNPRGELIYFLTSRVPIFDQNKKIIGVVGISIDITERKKMEADLITEKEKAESALKAKSDFFAVVSHELRTPLTGILGISDLLLSQPIQSEKEKEYLNHINNASKHLLSLINNILDFSKLNEEKFCLQHIAFDLHDIFNQVFNMLQVKAIERNLYLTLNYPTSYARYFMGDPRALMQVLINLIGNAIKFTKTGGISVKVVEKKHSETHAKILISITDSGKGIPKENLNSIFQRFEQLGANHIDMEFGTGLGLLVSQKIMQLMNSKITVKSTIGKGSVFSVIINFSLNQKPTLSQIKNTDEAIQPLKQKNLKLLLVEDDLLIQTIHKLKLSDYGFEIHMAEDAKQALALCEKKYFDLIFVDIGLPTISGIELIKKIRSNKGLNQHTLIIALTAYVNEANHEQALRAGANNSFCKPITNKIFNQLFAQYFN